MYRYGDVYMVNLKGAEHQLKGWHPAVVVQNNKGNYYSTNIQVVPISSSKTKSNLPTHVFLSKIDTGLKLDSFAQCEGQTIVDKRYDIGNKITTLSKNYMKKIAIGCFINSPLILELSLPEILKIKNEISKLQCGFKV